MLAVEQQPVEPGDPQHLSRDGAAQGAPAADQLPAGDHVLSEPVGKCRIRDGIRHVSSAMSEAQEGKAASLAREGDQSPDRSRAGCFGSYFQPGTMYCIAMASSLAVPPTFLYNSWAFMIRSGSISMPSPGLSGTATQPFTIFSGSFVRRSRPSCQIQCVSMAVMVPGAAAA